MNRIVFFIKQSWLVLVSSFLFGLLIAFANAAWAPRIEGNRTSKLNKLMQNLIPAATNFKSVEIENGSEEEKKTIYKAVSKEGNTIGWTFTISGQGWGGTIDLVVAVDPSFTTFYGFSVLTSSETPGFGARIAELDFIKQFIGVGVSELTLKKAGDASEIDSKIIAITGATVSSSAVVDIFNNNALPLKEKMLEAGLVK